MTRYGPLMELDHDCPAGFRFLFQVTLALTEEAARLEVKRIFKRSDFVLRPGCWRLIGQSWLFEFVQTGFRAFVPEGK